MKILITGTSKGIGRALAQNYLDKGFEVFGISRSENETLNAYPRFSFLPLDVSDFNKMKQRLPAFLENIGHLDLVILNAGILSEIKDLKDTPLAEIKKVMDINVWANKVLIDLCFEHIESIGQVVAISSGAAVSGSRGWNAYSLSKAALNMLIDLYAKENPNTHFSAIAPGLVDTAMQDYISSLPDDTVFPAVNKLKKAKNTLDMPAPDEAVDILMAAFKKVKQNESGSFVDVRNF